MRCVYCGHTRTQVVDSRPGRDGSHIRRRRSCPGCGRRFTTFEQPGEKGPYQSILLVGATRAEAEGKAREWATRTRVTPP